MTTKIIEQLIVWLKAQVLPAANLRLDSRHIQPGDVFVACAGQKQDGYAFIADAIQRGAAAVVYDAQHPQPECTVPTYEVVALPKHLGALAHEWYGRPSESLTIIAITGTNGKTSSVQWLAEALNKSGVPCVSIGTLGVYFGTKKMQEGLLTTPDVFSVHQILAQARAADINLVALEASSIGLDQGRLDGVAIDIAAFTNLSHDHLDYHGDWAHYGQSKEKLFQRPGLRRAVINLDDPFAESIRQAAAQTPVFTYSITQSKADFFAQDIHPGAAGQVFQLVGVHGTAQLLTQQLGLHNVSNYLLVAAVLNELGWPVGKIARLMATLEPVPGRMEIVLPVRARQAPIYGAPLVVVDYAHSPDALQHALETLREVAEVRQGRLWCLVGCGGNRDQSKRIVMGGVAQQYADGVVITNDNPRDEDPEQIAQALYEGALAVHEQIEDPYAQAPTLELDRARAILTTIWQVQPNDIVLIAGKGHETYQEMHGHKRYFSDSQWARLAVTWLQNPELSTDSRHLASGQLFLALEGAQFDGHDFVAQAAQRQALAAIVARPVPEVDMPQIVVGPTLTALQVMAACWRQRHHLPVVAVTGSNGKTTTKEMIASIFQQHYGAHRYIATLGNFNNHIGVPLSILRLRAEHQAAVFELGMNHPGEIAELAALVQPTVALVNNAQREHQEFMHTVEAVAKENGAVIQALPATGIAVLPADEPYIELWRQYAGKRTVVNFSRTQSVTVHAREVHPDACWTRFVLVIQGQEQRVSLHVPGVHNLHNALAAAACAQALSIPVESIAAGLDAFQPVEGRMQPKILADGHQLIDDSYNANPDSVRAAIEVLAQLSGKKILVLGDMAEVGIHHQAVHAEVGSYAQERGIDLLCVIGQDAQFAAEAFGTGAYRFDTLSALQEFLVAQAPAHYLVKGSRSAQMDRVVTHLEQAFLGQEGEHAS